MSIPLAKTYIHDHYTLYYRPDDTFVGGFIAKTGTYEPYETRLLLNSIRKGDSVIDIGANIGYYTLLMADAVGPDGRVYAFEPEPTTRTILEKNVQVNGFENVIISDNAIGAKRCKARLFLSKENYGDHQLYEGTNEESPRQSIPVPCDTLDHIFKKGFDTVSLIKIDTQGYEPFVVAGAKILIETAKPTLFLEYWPYGYTQSGADAAKMLSFFTLVYQNYYFIDEDREVLEYTDQPRIDNYCMGLGGTLHCNLLCIKRLDK